MSMVIHNSDVKILASTAEEISAEYVWTNCIDDTMGARYFRITIDGRQSCIVRALFADKNFRRNYSKGPRCRIEDDDKYIVMSAHYRRKLGGLETTIIDHQIHTVDFEEVIFGWLRASLYFPTPYACISSWLGVAGGVFGLLSLVLSVISLFCKCQCK